MAGVEIEYVSLDEAASPEEVAAVTAVFGRAGFEADVDANFGRKSAALLPWAIIVFLGTPLAKFFWAFFGRLGKRAADDVYPSLREFIKELIAARSSSAAPRGDIRFMDRDGTNLIVSAEITDEAIDALAQLDWEAMRGGWLLWDTERGEWRDATPR
jgi:hypothetical protein